MVFPEVGAKKLISHCPIDLDNQDLYFHANLFRVPMLRDFVQSTEISLRFGKKVNASVMMSGMERALRRYCLARILCKPEPTIFITAHRPKTERAGRRIDESHENGIVDEVFSCAQNLLRIAP